MDEFEEIIKDAVEGDIEPKEALKIMKKILRDRHGPLSKKHDYKVYNIRRKLLEKEVEYNWYRQFGTKKELEKIRKEYGELRLLYDEEMFKAVHEIGTKIACFLDGMDCPLELKGLAVECVLDTIREETCLDCVETLLKKKEEIGSLAGYS